MSATSYAYPESFELTEIEQAYMATALKDDPVMGDIFGVDTKDYDRVEWEQQDITLGMMQVRGMNSPPPSVVAPGVHAFSMRPGYYGEYIPISEQELTRRRKIGSYNEPIDITDLVYRNQDILDERRLVRMCFEGWTLLTTGQYTAYNINGVATDSASFSPRVFVPIVPYTNAGSSTPLADLRAIKLLKRGFSLALDSRAVAYANTTTMNAIQSNTNAADLYGRRVTGLATANSVDMINVLLKADNLPTYVEYDEGYYDNSGVFHTFIPDGYIVVVGRRPNNQKLGDWQLTRNASNPGLEPGPYAYTFDSLDYGRLPRSIEVHAGVNMGLALYYPFGYIIMKCF